jgi:hypothetical protein
VPTFALADRWSRTWRALWQGSERSWRALWQGETRSTPLALFRVGLALLVLARTTHWLRPWLALDHFLWTQGPEFSPALEGVVAPRLFSPLLPLPQLCDGWVEGLVHTRTALALTLLVGLWPRASALGLFVIGYGLMALDRYRYFHHMHLLWLSCLWLALLPSVRGWRLASPWRPRAQEVPRWPLQLLRAQCLIVYLAAGIAKLGPGWLSGAALDSTARAGVVGGLLWSAMSERLGTGGVACLIAATELSIVLLLLSLRARGWGIALGIALHLGLEQSMVVSTFGAQMVLYLLLFLPWERRNQSLDSS